MDFLGLEQRMIDHELPRNSSSKKHSIFHRLTLDLWLAKDNRFLNPKSSYQRILTAPPFRLIRVWCLVWITLVFSIVLPLVLGLDPSAEPYSSRRESLGSCWKMPMEDTVNGIRKTHQDVAAEKIASMKASRITHGRRLL